MSKRKYKYRRPKKRGWRVPTKQEKINRAYIKEIKEVPCADCGQSYPSCVMDFDHVTGRKLGNISLVARSWSLEKLIKEIAKCQIVCSNCHRIRTFIQRPPPPEKEPHDPNQD